MMHIFFRRAFQIVKPSFKDKNKNKRRSRVSAALPVRRNLMERLNEATLLKAESSTKGVWCDAACTVYGTEAASGS